MSTQIDSGSPWMTSDALDDEHGRSTRWAEQLEEEAEFERLCDEEAEKAELEAKPQCPQCGSADVERRTAFWKCRTCRSEWSPR